ncbi:F-box only protein 43 [Electrophorus electricus]|uniref:F-box only protein 43 n=1 Tax=Electrophorus electricus TaxID=8005 RepID=UPI0015CF9887|nr:F-box only protein 43 [Electrophorus electricus]
MELNECSSQQSTFLDSILQISTHSHELSSCFHFHNLERPNDLKRNPKKEHSLHTSWCETPKLTRKDASLRRRLLISRSATDGKISSFKTPGHRDLYTEGHFDNGSFESPDNNLSGPLSYSTLKTEDMVLSWRKRRLLFSQAITSTLEDGKNGVPSPPQDGSSLSVPELDESIISGLIISEMPVTPQSNNLLPLTKEHFQTPVKRLAENLCESLSVLSTPSRTPVSKLDTSSSEDSGFNSLGLDKSVESFEDSFLEGELPWAFRSREKRLSRLERQRRLSTLQEGGSQSEEDRKSHCLEVQGFKEDEEEVFLKNTLLGAARMKLQDLSLTPALQMVHAMSQRSTCFLSQHTGLEELLQLSVQDGSIRTSLPLSGLIGRKMGLGKLDILNELRRRNLRHILAVILKLLSPHDIYTCGQVSDIWDDIIMQDKKASHRRKLYERETRLGLEMGSAAHVPDAETRLTLACRSALSSVQAQAKTPRACTHTPAAESIYTPLLHETPISNTKCQEFLQVAKTLFSDECLKPCPRCQHPARCHVVRGEGICSWVDCLFHFCMACLCAYHGSRDCAHLLSKRRNRKDILPGSAQSKRNVRRL